MSTYGYGSGGGLLGWAASLESAEEASWGTGYTDPLQDGAEGNANAPIPLVTDGVPFHLSDVTLIGEYHTHGNYSSVDANGVVTVTTKANDNFNSDTFSTPDMTCMNQNQLNLTEYYLGTPSGTFLDHTPASGQTQILPQHPGG